MRQICFVLFSFFDSHKVVTVGEAQISSFLFAGQERPSRGTRSNGFAWASGKTITLTGKERKGKERKGKERNFN